VTTGWNGLDLVSTYNLVASHANKDLAVRARHLGYGALGDTKRGSQSFLLGVRRFGTQKITQRDVFHLGSPNESTQILAMLDFSSNRKQAGLVETLQQS